MKILFRRKKQLFKFNLKFAANSHKSRILKKRPSNDLSFNILSLKWSHTWYQ